MLFFWFPLKPTPRKGALKQRLSHIQASHSQPKQNRTSASRDALKGLQLEIAAAVVAGGPLVHPSTCRPMVRMARICKGHFLLWGGQLGIETK